NKWLTDSAVSNRLYCWPCLLLSKKKGTWTNEGYCDWKHFSRSASLHCSSQEHIQNEVSLKRMEREETSIDTLLSEQWRIAILQYNDNVRKNREVLKRLIDSTVFLSHQELAFCGHDETAESVNQGTYRQLFDYFFRHDDELRAHWQKNFNIFSGQSKTIQNEPKKYCCTLTMKSMIVVFFACEVDETTDISQLSQLSVVLQYVDGNGKTQERFMGFKDVSMDRTAVSLKQVIDSVITKYEYKTKLVSQSYDGTAVMAGELGGLQALIKTDAPQALFVHCLAHHLNLILQQEAHCFFATLNGFPTFFTHSGKQTELLDQVVGRRIPSMCAVRWTSTSRVLHAIVEERENLFAVYQEIIGGIGWDGESQWQATGYLSALKNAQFLFLAFCYCEIFNITDILYNILQKKNTDVNYCMLQIQQECEKIQNLRSKECFREIYEAVAKATAVEKRTRLDASFENKATVFARIYFEIIDNITMLADIKALRFLELADSSRFTAFSKQFPTKAFTLLANTYEKYFDLDRLKNEFNVIFSDIQFRECSVYEIIHIIVETELRDVLREVFRFFCLVATIPVTTVSMERSFSCLKHIKTYLRSSKDQGHLRTLATISMEKELLSFLEKQPTWYDNVIERFAA
uniref:DUF4371 domain-containing protein n=1 Tax=Latimeria chalumnae TaxID=7897 RepID=H3AMA8_LATCH